VSARKYRPDEGIDGVIRAAYERLRKHCDRGALRLAARRIGWPGYAVRKRALHLGLTRTKEPVWSEAEIRMLEQWGWMGDERIALRLRAAGFTRSATAIHLKRKRMRINGNGDWYSACSVAEAMGVDSHKVMRWIRTGLVKAERRGSARTEQQGGDTYLILRKAVKAFLLACPDEYDLGKVEKFWFLDLITDGRICR
jgi:hypothetical protein